VATVNGFRLSIPYLELANGGTTRTYKASLTSNDLASFAVDPASIAEVSATTTDDAAETGDTLPNCTERTVGSGKVDGTNELMPGSQRIRLATSTDGASFARTGITVLDQAATPSLVLSAAGLPYLYYTAHKTDGIRDNAALSIGNADATIWKHCQLNFTGMPSNLSSVDPDVVKRNNGSFRMYITGPISGNLMGIHYADSSDGINWAYQGVALQHASSVLDSITFEAGGRWHMYALNATSIDMVYASSSDGASFSFVDSSSRKIGGQPYVISQAIQLDGATRLYAFGPGGQEIRSFITSNGANLTEGTTTHLSFSNRETPESIFIKDPAVVQLPSGDVLMAYSTAIE
jgi:hypothetical protein